MFGTDFFGRCSCEACVGGYGDGPCGGYLSYRDRCGRRGNPSCGCERHEPCRSERHEPCREHRHECCNRDRRCPGLFITIPCGCFNIGFFL